MISAEEKKQFISDLMDLCSVTGKESNTQIMLHNMLMRDTNDGKLYKYRSVSEHSLDCLHDGTMYCAAPDSFNDPFDCRIGITFQSLYQAKYETEFDRLADVFEKFLLVCNRSSNLEDYDKTEQRIIRDLLNNRRIMEFVTKKQGTVSTLEEENDLLRHNGYIITDLLQTVLSDKSFKESLGICSDMLPKLYERITPDGLLMLSNDEASFEDFAKSNGVDDDADEIALTLQMSEKMFPENHEASESVKRILNNAEANITKMMNELFRIGCLATDFKNRLMWSHYADSHRGFCIEYDFSGTDENTLSITPFPVVYSEELPLIPWKATIDKTPENNAEATRQLMLGLLTKDKAWEYENEWRIMIKNGDDPVAKMPPISCVYLGANIDTDDKAQIIEIATQRGIPVKQMIIDRGSYVLHARDILI